MTTDSSKRTTPRRRTAAPTALAPDTASFDCERERWQQAVVAREDTIRELSAALSLALEEVERLRTISYSRRRLFGLMMSRN